MPFCLQHPAEDGEVSDICKRGMNRDHQVKFLSRFGNEFAKLFGGNVHRELALGGLQCGGGNLTPKLSLISLTPTNAQRA